MTAGEQAHGEQAGGEREQAGAARVFPAGLHWANETLAFLIELAVLAGLAWWGATLTGPVAVRVLAAVAAPLAAMAVWALMLAPRARLTLPAAGVLGVKIVLYAVTALAVYAAGLHGPAIAVGVVALLNACAAAADREAAGGGGRAAPAHRAPRS